MAAPVLTEEQRTALIEWLAAGHPEPLVQQLFAARGWKRITRQSVDHHRERHRNAIEQRRKEREAAAYDAGLAQWEEWVRALVRHAETLESLKWVPDDKGKLHNEKAWRETLDDIAREMGHRRAGVDVNVGRLSDDELLRRATEALAGSGAAGTDAATADGESDVAGTDPVLPADP